MPFCICLQESHLKPNDNFTLRGYKSFRKDVIPNLRARGGVITFVKDNLQVEEVLLLTNLQAVAVKIKHPYKMTICNLYLPDFNLTREELKNCIEQLPLPILILGDFNAHNPLWGSERIDHRGRIIEGIIDELDLVILNTGEGTFINSRSNKLSAIDLSICSHEITPVLKWQCLEEQNTDHIPISIECAVQKVDKRRTIKWITDKANWDLYREKLNHINILANTINEGVTELTEAIHYSADAAIPKSKGTVPKKRVPGGTMKLLLQ
ncbi:hypothetical protein JTB14_002125 [Gonioctena quinquepunctata]|nr:hypothetical protein JTB14_002125 [Gonioctena quinquepunctata]